LTKSATWGRQNSTVAYQLPSAVVADAGSGGAVAGTRSRNLFVPWTTNTTSVSRRRTVKAMFVLDLRHFLDLAEDTPGPARRMAVRLSLIVRAATAGDAGVKWVSALVCDRRPGRRRCRGNISIGRSDVPVAIEWGCTGCGDEGLISGWERNPYDLRRLRPVAVSDRGRCIVVPAEVAATLRDLQLVDRDTERLIFRARAVDEGAALVGDDDELDELLGYVAAEANHEENRRRQRRLDDAFEALSHAIDQNDAG
jgi:hypothetical protein